MKKIKSIFVCLSLLLIACLSGFLNMPNFSEKASANVVDSSLFTYASFSQAGQTLNQNNFANLDNVNYLITNGAVTMTFHPLNYLYTNFNNLIGNEQFYEKSTSIKLEKNIEGNFPNSIQFNGTTYFIRVQTNPNIVGFYYSLESSLPYLTTEQTSLVNITEATTNSVTLTIIESFTFKESADSVSIRFYAQDINSISPNIFNIKFVRPTVNFNNATNPILNFNTKINDIASTDSLLESEQEFNNVKIDFINNNYTEINPLYFNINYNGFTYMFKLYCKLVKGEELLFVNYFDNARPENNAYLASQTGASGEIVNKVLKTDANFNLNFKYTGRYQFEIYDSTYLNGFLNANYYSTSFYINSTNISAFNNIYIIAQTLNSNGSEKEYIVSKSTQNETIKLTIKNLGELDSSDSTKKLEDVIDKIEVRTTLYGGSNNEPVPTFYSPSQIRSMLNENGDLVFTFTEDADYDVIVYEKNSNKIIDYSLTIAKKAKTHYNANNINHTAATPYYTEVIHYTYNINDTMNVEWNFDSSSTWKTATLNKNYLNNYTISYGMEQVDIERITKDAEGNALPGLNLRFKGVGDLKVQITVNGETSTYDLNYENGNSLISFTDYGKYEIVMVDTMGTTMSTTIDYKQSLDASTIVLIVLSSLILIVIIVFVLRARAKTKTR